jgi:hypothetical protein
MLSPQSNDGDCLPPGSESQPKLLVPTPDLSKVAVGLPKKNLELDRWRSTAFTPVDLGANTFSV